MSSQGFRNFVTHLVRCLARIDRQESRTATNASKFSGISDVDIWQTGGEFGDIDALNAERGGRLVAKVGLFGKGSEARETSDKFIDQGGRKDVSFVQRSAHGAQAGILDTRYKGTEIEALRGGGRRGETTRALALRRIEIVLLPGITCESRVFIAETMVEPDIEAVVGDVAISGAGVVVEGAGAVRQRINAGYVCADRVYQIGWYQVAGKGVSDDNSVDGAGSEGIVDGNKSSALIPPITEVAGALLGSGHGV